MGTKQFWGVTSPESTSIPLNATHLQNCWLCRLDQCTLVGLDITKTCLYNFDSLKPHFYIVKLGFTGVYIIFLISAQNIDCGYSLELPHRGSSNEYPQSMFWAETWKISEFFIRKLLFFDSKIFSIFEYACFRNELNNSINTNKVMSSQSVHITTFFLCRLSPPLSSRSVLVHKLGNVHLWLI